MSLKCWKAPGPFEATSRRVSWSHFLPKLSPLKTFHLSLSDSMLCCQLGHDYVLCQNINECFEYPRDYFLVLFQRHGSKLTVH